MVLIAVWEGVPVVVGETCVSMLSGVCSRTDAGDSPSFGCGVIGLYSVWGHWKTYPSLVRNHSSCPGSLLLFVLC